VGTIFAGRDDRESLTGINSAPQDRSCSPSYRLEIINVVLDSRVQVCSRFPAKQKGGIYPTRNSPSRGTRSYKTGGRSNKNPGSFHRSVYQQRLRGGQLVCVFSFHRARFRLAFAPFQRLISAPPLPCCAEPGAMYLITYFLGLLIWFQPTSNPGETRWPHGIWATTLSSTLGDRFD